VCIEARPAHFSCARVGSTHLLQRPRRHSRNVTIFCSLRFSVSACVALGDAPPARSRLVSALGFASTVGAATSRFASPESRAAAIRCVSSSRVFAPPESAPPCPETTPPSDSVLGSPEQRCRFLPQALPFAVCRFSSPRTVFLLTRTRIRGSR
jgi:hypothetical protein